MSSVEARHDEKSAGEGIGRQAHPPAESGNELVQLAEFESKAQEDGGGPQEVETAPVVVCQRVGGEMACERAREQHNRVDHRDRIPVDVKLADVRGWRRRPDDM